MGGEASNRRRSEEEKGEKDESTALPVRERNIPEERQPLCLRASETLGMESSAWNSCTWTRFWIVSSSRNRIRALFAIV